jgi:Protein-disulfide isomerase
MVAPNTILNRTPAMGQRLERLVSITLGVAALAVASSALHREFWAPPTSRNMIPPPEYVDGWRTFARSGIWLGDSTAPVTIIEFADFQCPFCARYAPTLAAVQNRYRDRVARVFVHLPLSMHQFAHAAARAAECADQQGKFLEMETNLYAKQDSFGMKPWSAYADDAGVSDAAAFQQCARGPEDPARVLEGLALARRVGVNATPTIIVNGWRYTGGPPDSILSRDIDRLLKGKPPAEVESSHFSAIWRALVAQ